MTSDGQLVQRGVANLGTAPTLRPGPERRLEVHLLETRSPLDLYGRKLLVEFVDWIRPERRFSGLPELVAQIESDRQQASAKLGE
jgi:riboflavin kinase/FMN adenylyltransferase